MMTQAPHHELPPPIPRPEPPADPTPAGADRVGLVLGAAAVAVALVAGLNYTFAVAVMPNLAGADDRTFVATTQRFNDNPVFVLSFTVALLLAIGAAVLHRRRDGGVAARWTLAAVALYGIVVAVTMAVNVPLNDEITQAGAPDRIADLAAVRERFEAPWVAANIVRTVLCTASVAAFARALILHGGTRRRSSHE